MPSTATRPTTKSSKAIGKKKLIPLGERVLVKVEKAPTMTPGGLHLPDSMQKKNPSIGEIVELGTDITSPDLYVGAIIYFQPYAGFEVPDMENHLVLKVEDILIVEGN